MNMQSTIATAGLCAGLFAFSSLPASAAWELNDSTLTDGTNWTLNVTSDTVNKTLTIAKRGGSGVLDLTDVEQDTGYKVVALADDAFYNYPYLTGISGLSNLVSIGSYAFKLSGLSGVLECPNLETIAGNAFQYTGLKQIRALRLTAVNGEAFNGCGVTNVIFGDALKSIGNSAFAGCSALVSATVGSALESMGTSAFEGCAALADFFPKRLPNLRSIGTDAFWNARVLTGAFECPALTTIGSSVFAGSVGAPRITSFYAPRLKDVSASAFKGCGQLGSVTLCGGGTLGDNCLYDIKAGATVRFMGAAPTSIGSNSFYPVGSNPAYIVVLVARSRHLAGWEGKYAPLTDNDRARTDFPGKRTQGRVKNSNDTAMAWLVDDDHAAQTIFIVQ